MILIADSGSTKCDWVLVDNNGEQQETFRTMGFNPYFHSADLIHDELAGNVDFMRIREDIQHVFFYGAGCSSEELVAIVVEALTRFFSQASTIMVDHDLVAAAYATYDGEPAISCILGTGSNSCYFDGQEVSEEVPALAYILGDEGSGSYYGKKLLSGYLYGHLPKHIENRFFQEYGLDKDAIIDRVYHRPHANVYLAAFMEFIAKNKDEKYFRAMITKGMEEFLRIHVLCFEDYKNLPVHFVGSLASIFEDILREVAMRLDVRIGKLVRRPIDGLVEYHRKVMIPQLEMH